MSINNRNMNKYGIQGSQHSYDNRLKDIGRIGDFETEGDHYQYGHEQKVQSKLNYKYAYYKDHQNQHSRDSLAFDSLRGLQRGQAYKPKIEVHKIEESAVSNSPAFRKNQTKPKGMIEYEQPHIQSNRSNSQQDPSNYELESQQISFLKQKLIEIHNKLLKELQKTNRLTSQLEIAQTEVLGEQKQNQILINENQKMKKQLSKMQLAVSNKYEKNQEKIKSLEAKYYEQSKKNSQLRDDLESMRNKMLQTLKQKNDFEETNTDYRQKVMAVEQSLSKLKGLLREKDQQIEYLSKQLDLMRKKFDHCEKECQARGQEVHQYNHLAAEREKLVFSLQGQLRHQKQKNGNVFNEVSNLQSDNKALGKKLDELEQLCQKYKGEIYWLENNKQASTKNHNQMIEKLNRQVNSVMLKLKQKDREVDSLKRKPIIEAERKKKNYQNTKEFVNKLENEQTHIGFIRDSAARAQSKGISPKPRSEITGNRSLSKSPNHRLQENPITHEPLTHQKAQAGYMEEKKMYISMLSQVGELEAHILNLNIQKKNILAEMDKIDGTKVKTKEMISKRRKLDEELENQEENIKKMKEELRKLKA